MRLDTVGRAAQCRAIDLRILTDRPVLRRILTYVVQVSAVGVVYYLIARLSLDLASVHPSATTISAPAGFAFAAVLIGGYRVVPAIFAAAFFVYALASGPSYVAAAIAVGNALEAFAGCFLLNRFAAGRDAFAAPAGIATFAWIAVFAAALGATVGTIVSDGVIVDVGAIVSSAVVSGDIGTLALADTIDWARFAAIWFPWWLGDLAAILLITPVLVLWTTDRPRSFGVRSLSESTAIFAAAGAFGAIAFSPLMSEMPNRASLGVLAILPLLWAALRRGPRDTATTALILSGLVFWGAISGGGPLASGPHGEPSTLLLMFMIGITMPSIALAADVALRRRTDRILGGARRELTQAREQFAQAQKMEAVGQLTGGVAHDFNNLLTVIVGNLDIAQRYLESSTEGQAERLRRVINNAMRGAQRATIITQRLLVFSRKQPLDPKPLSINALLEGLTDFLRRSLGETVALDIVAGDGLWQVKADPIQLEAAILNLAVNARDAMAEGGKLTIATSNSFLDEAYCRQHDELVAGEYVQIAVTDTGKGMSKDVLERVFEPFFTTKQVGQGTGLGLSQVSGFVKQSARQRARRGHHRQNLLASRAGRSPARADGPDRRRARRCRPDHPPRRGRPRCSRLCGRNPSRTAFPRPGGARRGLGARNPRSQRCRGGFAADRCSVAGNEWSTTRRRSEVAPTRNQCLVHERLFARGHRRSGAPRTRRRDDAEAADARDTCR